MPSTGVEDTTSVARGNETGLRRQLSAGQITMVAVGGSIGTGLLLGSAAAIELAGPAVIVSYVFAAFVSLLVTMALGELASAHPAAGSFGVYADLYLNQWAGFLSRTGYWAAIAVSIGAELVASSTYMAFWFPRVPMLVWAILFSLFLLLMNMRSVGEYGRFEYWFAMVKVITILAFVVIGAGLLLGGRATPQYTLNGGFFPKGVLAPMLAITFAIYAFGGVEFVAVTSGESRSSHEVAQAAWMTSSVLTVVYIGAIVVLVGVMPWNRAGVTESPFVTVFRQVNLPGASHVMNFVVLTAALSGANAALYISSRMLFSLARSGWAPSALGRLNSKGSPVWALLVSAYGIAVALILVKWAPQKAFEFILRGSFTGMMLSWIVSLAAHIVFRRKISAAGIAELPIRSPFGAWGSILGLLLVCATVLKTWWDSQVNFVSGVVGIVLITVTYFAIKAARAGRG